MQRRARTAQRAPARVHRGVHRPLAVPSPGDPRRRPGRRHRVVRPASRVSAVGIVRIERPERHGVAKLVRPPERRAASDALSARGLRDVHVARRARGRVVGYRRVAVHMQRRFRRRDAEDAAAEFQRRAAARHRRARADERLKLHERDLGPAARVPVDVRARDRAADVVEQLSDFARGRRDVEIGDVDGSRAPFFFLLAPRQQTRVHGRDARLRRRDRDVHAAQVDRLHRHRRDRRRGGVERDEREPGVETDLRDGARRRQRRVKLLLDDVRGEPVHVHRPLLVQRLSSSPAPARAAPSDRRPRGAA
eukprot:30477-Pelagococcus_subviridis.AAC.1